MAPAADAVQAVASSVTTPFSASQQTVSLSANVSDTTHPSTTVSEGTVTFTVKDSGGNPVGSAVQGTVSGGKASASFNLPAAEASGKYNIDVSYSDSAGTFTDGGTDTPGTLTVSAPTTTTASDATVAFSSSAQNVTLNATVTSSSGTVNEGTVTFTVLQGTQVIGSATSNAVSSGSANVSYALPAGTGPGSYTIEAAYTDSTGTFAGSSDTSHTLTVTSSTAASTTTSANNATATFSLSAQNVTLSAKVTSGAGTVNEGTVTFTLLNSQGATVGTATAAPVDSSGNASVSYSLPAGTAPGSYTIEANYTDSTGNFAISSDTSHSLTVNAATTTTTALNTTTAFKSGAQDVTLTADVTSSAGTVSEGSVLFTVLQGTTVIGTATSGTVSGGSASVSYALPAGTAAGSYTIKAAYSDSSGNFAASSDSTHNLTINAASTTTAASDATATFSTGAQNVTLTATVTSSAGTVNEGSVAFTLVDSNGNTIGSTTTSSVSNGSASVSYALPAGTEAGTYTIQANYTDSAGNFAASLDDTHTLTLNSAGFTSVGLISGRISPNVTNGTAQVTLTAQVSIPGGTVSEGSVSFTVGNVSGQANLSNGTATVQLTLPISTVLNGFNVSLSYTDSVKPANFASSSDTVAVATNVWNSLLPSNLTFDSSGNETMQFTLASLPLFGASYSTATGLLLLSQISLGSTSVPMTYSNIGTTELASAAGIPWGMIFRDSSGNVQGLANVQTGSDGSLVWVFYNSNHQVIGQMPYGG